MKKIFRGVLIGLLILMCVLILGFLILFRPDEYGPISEVAIYYQPAPTPGSDLDFIEADAGISIPDSAREINAMISGFRELDTWVRLDIPANELKSFLENTHCRSDLVSTDPALHAPGDLDPDWWEPNKAEDLVECLGYVSNMRQYILVDRTKPNVFTVYVFSIVDDFSTPSSKDEDELLA